MESKGNQVVTFNVKPTENPDEVIQYADYVENASSGIGMDILKQIVEEHIPIVDCSEGVTTKEIIRTDRYECPCCATDISAIVRVDYNGGPYSKDVGNIKGLYLIDIYPNRKHTGCRISVNKLQSKQIYTGCCNYLAKKEYKK